MHCMHALIYCSATIQVAFCLLPSVTLNWKNCALCITFLHSAFMSTTHALVSSKLIRTFHMAPSNAMNPRLL